jgi:transcription elongation factor Elf1
MPRLREQFDADRMTRDMATDYRSTTNRYEIPCSVCGKLLFVDAETKRDFDRSIEHDLDNTFTCSECEEEYDGLAFE